MLRIRKVETNTYLLFYFNLVVYVLEFWPTLLYKSLKNENDLHLNFIISIFCKLFFINS